MAYKAKISKAWKSGAKHHADAANAGDMVSGSPHKDAPSQKHSHQKVDDAGTGNQRIVTTLEGGTSYTPPVRTKVNKGSIVLVKESISSKVNSLNLLFKLS